MLASCVLLDCARFRKGRVDELFGNYEKFFDYAMSEFLELHYPCSYVSADGRRKCVLVKARHQPKGHQDNEGIIAAGDYEAAFDGSFLPTWKTQLRSAIEGIHRDFSYELEQLSQVEDTQAIPEEKIALVLHEEHLNQFFELVGPASSICSHATWSVALSHTHLSLKQADIDDVQLLLSHGRTRAPATLWPCAVHSMYQGLWQDDQQCCYLTELSAASSLHQMGEAGDDQVQAAWRRN